MRHIPRMGKDHNVRSRFAPSGSVQQPSKMLSLPSSSRQQASDLKPKNVLVHRFFRAAFAHRMTTAFYWRTRMVAVGAKCLLDAPKRHRSCATRSSGCACDPYRCQGLLRLARSAVADGGGMGKRSNPTRRHRTAYLAGSLPGCTCCTAKHACRQRCAAERKRHVP